MSQDQKFLELTCEPNELEYGSIFPLTQYTVTFILQKTTYLINSSHHSPKHGVLYKVNRAPPKKSDTITLEACSKVSSVKLRSALGYALGLEAEVETRVMNELQGLLQFYNVNTKYSRTKYDTNNNNNAGVEKEWPRYLDLLITIHIFKVRHVPNHEGLLTRTTTSIRDDAQEGGSLKRKRVDDDDDDECSICLQDFDEKNSRTSLCCDHSFHEECLVTWLRNRLNCPLCRKRVHLDDS